MFLKATTYAWTTTNKIKKTIQVFELWCYKLPIPWTKERGNLKSSWLEVTEALLISTRGLERAIEDCTMYMMDTNFMDNHAGSDTTVVAQQQQDKYSLNIHQHLLLLKVI